MYHVCVEFKFQGCILLFHWNTQKVICKKIKGAKYVDDLIINSSNLIVFCILNIFT
jgi:hypothetical protein